MRTTLNLDDDLLIRAKAAAAHSGRTLTSVIEDALRAALARRDEVRDAVAYEISPFAGDGLRGGVDLDDSGALRDVLESRG